MQFSQSYSKHSFSRCFTVKEDEGRTLWLDTQSHASSSASSADDDYSWQWPTSFWSQFKVSTLYERLQQLPNTIPFYSLKHSLSPRLTIPCLGIKGGNNNKYIIIIVYYTLLESDRH